MNEMEVVKAVWAAIDSEPEFAVELTRELVRIPSVNPKFQAADGLNDEARVQDVLEAQLREAGFETSRHEALPGRPNLVADRAGDEARSMILNGHVDTVPVGDRASWSVDPFGGEVKDGRLYGRGAVDMKSGLAACVAAARFIERTGVRLAGRLSVHAVVDEEAGGFGAMEVVRRGLLARAVIVTEPTWSKVIPAEGGLEWARVTITGRSGHAGWRYNDIFPQPQVEGRVRPAVNAIELAARFLAALREFERGRCRDRWHPLCPPGLATINPGVIHGGVGLGEDGLPAIRTNPAMTPDKAVIDLDYKFMPDECSEDVRAEFEGFVRAFAQTDAWLRDHPPEVAWELGGLHFPPMDTPADHPLVRALVENHAALADPPKVCGFDAVTDAAHYAGAGVAAVLYGPSGDGFHGDDEHVDLASLHRTAKVVAAAAIAHCGVR
jgi:acetylornithine deacetylase